MGQTQSPNKRLAKLRSAAPECCRIWRYETGWVTADIMVDNVRLLVRCLKEFQSSHCFILYFGASRAHISTGMLPVASRAGLWVCVIPGKTK